MKSFSSNNDDSKKNSSNIQSSDSNISETSSTKDSATSENKKTKKTKASSTVSFQDTKPEEKKLKSTPIRPIKLPLDKDEEKIKPETYVLFSSPSPIIPFSQQQGFVRTGNLGTTHISNKLAFFIQNDAGEIYTVGLVLENNVNKSLKKNISTQGQSTSPPLSPTQGLPNEKNKHKANITTKPKNYKVKLVEIEFKDNCIFAKGIPYKDTKITEEEKQINVLNVIIQIKNLILTLKQSVSHEKIEVFNNISFDSFNNNKNYDPEKLDEMLCLVVGECNKITNYTKENLQHFIQAFLEQRSLIARLFMVKKKLEEIKNVLDIVNRSIQYADEQIWKFHEQAKAKLSLDYIRSNYFTPSEGGSQNSKQSSSSNSNTSNEKNANMNLSP